MWWHWLSLTSAWAGTELGLSRLTLRFSDPRKEEGYVESKSEKVIVNSRYCLFFQILGAGGVLTSELFFESWWQRSIATSDHVYTGRIVQMSVVGFATLLCLLLLALLYAPRALRRTGSQRLELILSAHVALCLLLTTFGQDVRIVWYLGRSAGQSIQETFPGNTDSTYLLVMVSFMTTTHQSLPLRWCMLAPLEVIGAVCYLTVVVLGSPEKNPHLNLALLTLIIACESMGKRAVELNHRRAFHLLLHEKSLRFQAEFKLAQMEQRSPQPATDAESSVPETTRTGQVFNALRGRHDGDVKGSLQEIAQLGQQEHWLLDVSDVSIDRSAVLGEGGFSVVLAGNFVGQPVAVKVPKHLHNDRGRMLALGNELRVLRQLRHSNIVSIFGAIVEPETQRVAIVLELVEGITVRAFIAKFSPSRPEKLQVVLGVCRGLCYLHTRRPAMVHGDLKDANVMVELLRHGVRAKLLDFGLARVVTRRARPLGGTRGWAAPELASCPRPRPSADVFSFGLFLHYISTGQSLLSGKLEEDIRLLKQQSLHLKASALQDMDGPLIKACLRLDEAQRPSMMELLAQIQLWAEGPEVESQPDPAAAEDLLQTCPRPPAPVSPRISPRTSATAGRFGSADAATGSRLHPGLQRTSPGAMRTTLMSTVMTWNIDMPESCCCPYHASLAAVERVRSELLPMKCTQEFVLQPTRQCEECGVLLVDIPTSATFFFCEVCGASRCTGLTRLNDAPPRLGLMSL